MTDWASTLLGSGLVGTPILGLVLSGRLIPIWVVNKQVAALEKSQTKAIEALEASHQRELISQAQAHADTLKVRDREADRQARAIDYEREAKDIERSRSDAATSRLGDLAAEFGGNHRKLVDAVSEAATRDR